MKARTIGSANGTKTITDGGNDFLVPEKFAEFDKAMVIREPHKRAMVFLDQKKEEIIIQTLRK